jgi:hypothetical protein
METERRLIDANFLVNKMIPNCPIEEGGIPLGDFDKHQKILALYPTVDAVEVVRCKDCESYDEDGEYCKMWCGVRHPEHFCGEGERRTDNG